jgi:hypothetical protein
MSPLQQQKSAADTVAEEAASNEKALATLMDEYNVYTTFCIL